MALNDLRVKASDVMGPRLPRLQSIAMGMAAVGLILCVLGILLDREGLKGFFHSYLYAYLFWIAVTAGSLGVLMLHHVVGGGWGFLIRRFMEAATRLIPVMALLFIPVIIGLVWFDLYEWTHADNPALRIKSPYLNIPFFIGRAMWYFLLWWLLARFFNRASAIQDERDDAELSNRLNVVGGAGLVLYVLMVTFVTVDWVMSLTPEWYSSIFGFLVVVSHALSTLALMMLLLGYLVGDQPLMDGIPSGYFRDLGNLMLAFVLLWAYMSFSQYLITYSGNTAEEITWYLDRRRGGWGIISLGLIVVHFLIPFLILLLGSNVKRSPVRLARVAGYLVLMRFVDVFWWVTPTFRDHLSISLADLGTPLLIGGIWLWLWAGQIKDQYLLPLHDARLEGALQGHGVAEHV
jgi:hypothetical protein